MDCERETVESINLGADLNISEQFQHISDFLKTLQFKKKEF